MTAGYTMDDLLTAAEAAIRAPSLHNSQPWRFRLGDGGIEVVVDPLRLAELPARDWGARISCGAAYGILFGDGDDPPAWLRAGEALSAVLLTAVAEGLSAAPISDPVEVIWPRQQLRELLAGLGQPYLVVRIGTPADPDGVPPVPRRDPAEVIERRA